MPPESRIFRSVFILVMFFTSILANLSLLPSRDDELEDYCAVHKFEKLPNGLRFTKEIVTMEYANIGAFKAIHCCLRGYRSIEWYKDDKAYPWLGAVSNFILYPESANQTIYTQSARISDVGRYSCRARNDTDILVGDISLEIVGEETNGYTGKPLPTYKPVSQLVTLGGAVRLFCEAYLGKVDLPDARNSVTWTKAGSNITVPVHGRVSQHRVSREDDQVVGSYLEIDATKPKDYGEYECIISNGADDEMMLSAHIYHQDSPYDEFGIRSSSWRKALLFIVLGLILIVTIIAFYIRCWLSLAIICRDKFFGTYERDEKEFDALVCYHEKDGALAVGTLVPTLEIKHRYKCSTLELSHLKSNWHVEIGLYASISHRIIVILSRNAFSNEGNDANVSAVLKSLSLIKNHVIVIILNEFINVSSFVKLTGGRTDNDVGVSDNNAKCSNKIKVLRWKINSENDISESQFWCRLRLAMPPKSSTNTKNNQSLAMMIQTKCITPKIRSRESSEVLV